MSGEKGSHTVNGSLLKTESTCEMPLELTRFKQL